ncbi:MAG: integrase core domain-containing protein [Janthinobacterium lividum]
MAICQPPPGLLVHADRSSQYTSEAFTSLLNRTQAIASLSRPGNPYDNALAESGWSTLKTELLPRGTCFADLEEARLELAEYLDYYYNTQRLHAALGYCTPREIALHYPLNLPSLGVRLYPTTSVLAEQVFLLGKRVFPGRVMCYPTSGGRNKWAATQKTRALAGVSKSSAVVLSMKKQHGACTRDSPDAAQRWKRDYLVCQTELRVRVGKCFKAAEQGRWL